MVNRMLAVLHRVEQGAVRDCAIVAPVLVPVLTPVSCLAQAHNLMSAANLAIVCSPTLLVPDTAPLSQVHCHPLPTAVARRARAGPHC